MENCSLAVNLTVLTTGRKDSKVHANRDYRHVPVASADTRPALPAMFSMSASRQSLPVDDVDMSTLYTYTKFIVYTFITGRQVNPVVFADVHEFDLLALCTFGTACSS